MSDPTSQSLVSQQFSRWLQVRKVGTCSTTTATIIIYLYIYLLLEGEGFKRYIWDQDWLIKTTGIMKLEEHFG